MRVLGEDHHDAEVTILDCLAHAVEVLPWPQLDPFSMAETSVSDSTTPDLLNLTLPT
jgi:hypothetical protein